MTILLPSTSAHLSSLCAHQVRLLADPLGEFTKALGLDTNLPPLGGLRSKRYAMSIDNGVVKDLNVEPDEAGTGLTCSLAELVKI